MTMRDSHTPVRSREGNLEARQPAGTSATAPDRCPGVLRLHEAADGLLARVRLVGGRISPEQLQAVASGAELGNGIIELTSRASLQIRGLADASVSTVLEAAGLLPSHTHERVRNIIASPLAGRHPLSVCDTDATVASLDLALCADPALSALSARFLFGVDDGAGMLGRPVDALIGPGDSIDEALAAAHASLHGGGGASKSVLSGPQLTLGPITQRDGRIALTFMPPLARLDVAMTLALAEIGTELRLSVHRTLTMLDLDPAAAPALIEQLDSIGFVTDPRSGWVGVTACAGLGACTWAERDVRALARERAAARDASDPPEHWAACERNCGRPDELRP